MNKNTYIPTETIQGSLDKNKNSVSSIPPAILRQEKCIYIHSHCVQLIF